MRGMVQHQQRRGNKITITPTAVRASRWSNDFYSRRYYISDYKSSTCICRCYYHVYIYYYRDYVQALASATAISSAATRATLPTTCTAALSVSLYLATSVRATS